MYHEGWNMKKKLDLYSQLLCSIWRVEDYYCFLIVCSVVCVKCFCVRASFVFWFLRTKFNPSFTCKQNWNCRLTIIVYCYTHFSIPLFPNIVCIVSRVYVYGSWELPVSTESSWIFHFNHTFSVKTSAFLPKNCGCNL